VREIYKSFFNVKTLHVRRGRKPWAQASRIFYYFQKMVTMEVLCYNGEKEKKEVEKELPL